MSVRYQIYMMVAIAAIVASFALAITRVFAEGAQATLTAKIKKEVR